MALMALSNFGDCLHTTTNLFLGFCDFQIFGSLISFVKMFSCLLAQDSAPTSLSLFLGMTKLPEHLTVV